MTKKKQISSFLFQPGDVVAKKYSIVKKLGKGWEGEVYLVKEKNTGVERAAKLFFPVRNKGDRAAKRYAKKLHKLRSCPLTIQYHSQEIFLYKEQNITIILSEFVEGELLSTFLKKQPSKRLRSFEALHLLHSLTFGLADMHEQKEYHGDIHTENIMVTKFGFRFDLKLIDLYEWKDHTPSQNKQDDIFQAIRVFYDALGGSRTYSSQTDTIKSICLGLRKSAIRKKFKNARKLKECIETLEIESYKS